MGFVPDEVLYNVDFSGTKLAGLEITLKDIDTDELLALGNLAAQAGGGSGGNLNVVDQLLTKFAEVIHSWNLEAKDGTPVPVSRQALGKRSLPRFVLPVLHACIDAINGVDEDLGKGSPSGVPSPEASLPMAPL